LRLIVEHPQFEAAWASSRSRAGTPVTCVHPNLQEASLRLSTPDEVPDLDVLFCATPHGTTASQADRLRDRADLVVDLSADFRLDDAKTYQRVYGQPHPAPDRLGEAAYGLPELDRDPIRTRSWIAGPGCIATASQLALNPVAGLDSVREAPIVVDAKIGSSAAGSGASRWASHAARSATVRPYAPTGHRHAAEIRQNVLPEGAELRLAAHAVDLPRGVLATAHLATREALDRRTLQRALQDAYADEPFVDVLAGRERPGGVPEPTFVAGTSRAQVAAVPREGAGAVVLCAIDNLDKGAAGSAIQSANLALGLEETSGPTAQAGFP
jgi:N-acetyl-gamma-glutamyl-phosphate/LysW-gamma-L-alpha-aminoadipyl-6-phosphate reductase